MTKRTKLIFLTVFLKILIEFTVASDLKVEFIKTFIENEEKPTILSFNLCWGKATELTLAKTMMGAGVRITSTIEPSEFLDQNLLFTVDLNCSFTEELLTRAASNNILGTPYRWLVFSFPSSDENILGKLPFLADSELVVARMTGDGFEMVELYKTSLKAPLTPTLRGFYQNGSLTDIRPHRSLFRRRKDLQGSPLTMSNVIQDSNTTQYHLVMEDRLEPEYDPIAKISWSVVKLGFLMLNATPRHIFSHRWGYKVNGKFSGMVDDLLSGRADVGTNCLMKTERLPIISFTDNMANFRVRFVFRQPPLPYVSNIFSLPFSTGVWLGLFVCSVTATACVYLASRWEAGLGKSPTQLDGSVGDALLLTMSAIGQQGCAMEPKKASGRIMLWIFFAALMALYAAYSANIVVLLQAPSNAIGTLSQLAHSKMTIAGADVDYNYFSFQLNRGDPIRAEIFKKVWPDKGRRQFYEFNEGVERMRQGLFAFHAIVEPIYRQVEKTFLEHEKCDLMEVDYMNDIDPFTPIRKNSPYLELLRVVFKQIREAGIREVLTNRLMTPKPKCSQKGVAFSSVGLIDLEPVLLLMLYGSGLAAAILAAEVVLYRVTHLRRHNPQQ